uniref:C-type lectin domain-containing protein n=1 Tax=Paramormyrops kingsleyae TaxID=1676925 RepID=A0A3B3S2K5_9TELE
NRCMADTMWALLPCVPSLPTHFTLNYSTVPGPCPAGYTSWYKNCYKLVAEQKTWEEAQALCVQEKGNLASIDHSYEQAFVAGAVLQGKSDAWIGLRVMVAHFTWKRTCNNQERYSWPVFFTHWGPGEPSNHKDEGYCVEMYPDGKWNDNNCLQKRGFACRHHQNTDAVGSIQNTAYFKYTFYYLK